VISRAADGAPRTGTDADLGLEAGEDGLIENPSLKPSALSDWISALPAAIS
jgi:hypothetical protein